MVFSLETFAALATIIGTVIAVLATIQSSEWLVLVSSAIACLSLGAVFYARAARKKLNAASTVIEGHSIDSLNIANLRRRINRTFVIQEAHHTARIAGEHLEITWKYNGFCKAGLVSSMEFSIDSEGNTEFEKLDCVAFDLGRDPAMQHTIRPILVGTEGVSKKISVPFLEPLRGNEPFSILLRCTLPHCFTSGFGYYTSTLSFAQEHVRRCVVHLIFDGTPPRWVRVYESTSRRPNELRKSLAPTRLEAKMCEYIDVAENRPGQSATVYAFWRDSI
jgi:hypothetical protein